MDWIAIISRWTHVGTAIVLVGGTCFLRFVLAPAAAQLSESEHEKLKGLVMATWKRFVHIGIALFLVSGLYNFIVVQLPAHKGDKFYRHLMEVKVLISLVIFFLASALVGRSKSFESMRRNSKLWQSVLIVLAAIVVGISGFAKVALKPTSSSGTSASAISDEPK